MVWTGTANKIFGNNVHVVPVFPGQMIFQIMSPTCYIVLGDTKFHDQHPNILFQRFQLYFFVENIVSEYGQSGLLGGNRTANTSRGVGMFDLENEVMTQVKKLNILTSKVSLVEESSGRCQYAHGNTPIIYRQLTFSVLLNDF